MNPYLILHVDGDKPPPDFDYPYPQGAGRTYSFHADNPEAAAERVFMTVSHPKTAHVLEWGTWKLLGTFQHESQTVKA